MKQNWTYKKLGEVCEVLDSKRKPVTKSKRISGIYPYYGATGIQDYVDKFIFDGNYLLVGEDGAKWGTSDKTAYQIHGKCWVNNHAHILKVNDDVANTSFLEYYLVWKDLRPFITGAIVQKLTQAALVSIPIPLLPLSIQSRIVSELDLLQAIIDKQKAQLAELNNLAQSIFYDMFGDPVENEKGWEVKKLGDIAMVKIGPFGSLLHTSDYITGGTPLVNPIHMKNGQISSENSFTISDEKKKEMQPYLLKKGDVIFARRGEIGRCAIVSEKEDGYLCGTGSLFVRFTEPIRELFVLYLIKSDSFIKDLVSKAKGATMLNINCKIVEDLQLTLPPLSLQQSFAKKVEAIERQKELINQSIREARALFDSRMEYYFGV